jgi:hypothetical protein
MIKILSYVLPILLAALIIALIPDWYFQNWQMSFMGPHLVIAVPCIVLHVGLSQVAERGRFW